MKHRSPLVACTAFRASTLLLAAAIAVPAAAQKEAGPGFAPEISTPGLVTALDGTLLADGRSHRARFDAAGARIDVAHPDDASSDLSATLRLVDHGRPGHIAAVSQGLPTQAGTDLVRYDHGLVVERYRVDKNGFEQSFVLSQRPTGHGDYVLGIAVTGAGLELPELEAAHQSVQLRHQGCASIQYGEAVVFERGGRPVPIATRCDGAGRIELIVPGKFLDSARYPVVIDPAVGPTFLPGGSIYSDSAPDVAQDANTGNFLFVWHRQFSSTAEIRGRIYRRDGVPLTPITVLSNPALPGPCKNPTVCGLNGFLVAYETADHLSVRNFGTSSFSAAAPRRTVSWPAAGEKDRRPCISGDGHDLALLVYDRTAANATEPNEIRATTVFKVPGITIWGASTGLVIESVTSGFVRRPRIPRNTAQQIFPGGDYPIGRVVWERFYTSPAPGDFDVRTACIRGSGGGIALLSGPTTVPGSAVGPNEMLPDIGMLGDDLFDLAPRFLVAWDAESDVKAHRYALFAPVGSEIDIRSTSDVETHPAVGGGATEFTVAYLQAVPPNEFSLNVRAARVLPDGSVPISDRAVDVLNGPFQGGLRVSSMELSTATAERRNTVMIAWHGVTGPASGAFDVRARLFEPVVASVFPFGLACPGPQGEMPFIDTIGEPTPGNGSFEITVDNAPLNSLAALVVGNVLTTNSLPGAPGCALYMGLPLLNAFPVLTSPNGFGTVPVAIPPGVPSGAVLAFQWAVYTPGHNAFGWITSNDLDISWSHF